AITANLSEPHPQNVAYLLSKHGVMLDSGISDMPTGREVILVEQIEPRIRQVRGQKIILDRDLAELYGVATKRLNEKVRRNIDRFPDDFVLQLTAEEAESLRLQNATSKPGRGGQ